MKKEELYYLYHLGEYDIPCHLLSIHYSNEDTQLILSMNDKNQIEIMMKHQEHEVDHSRFHLLLDIDNNHVKHSYYFPVINQLFPYLDFIHPDELDNSLRQLAFYLFEIFIPENHLTCETYLHQRGY